jgi:hypothetical protein
MNKVSFRPVAVAPGAVTAIRVPSRKGIRVRARMRGRKALIKAEAKMPASVVSTAANLGVDAIAFSLWSIWDEAKYLASRAWDAINEVLTDEGGGGDARTKPKLS